MNKWMGYLKDTRIRKDGFTIVELLIVIVVIAILAAITIVAYNGIQQRAKSSALQSSVSQLAKRVETSKISASSETYPTTLAAVNIQTPANTNYSVSPSGKAFCIRGVDGSAAFYATSQQLQATPGDCVTADGLVGWWRFNNSLADTSGYGADATTNNVAPTTGEDGTANSAYAFGPANTTTASGAALPTGGSPRTVLAWVTTASYPASTTWSMALSWGANGTAGASALSIHPSGRVTFNGQSNDFQSTFVLPLNQWHLIGYTLSGSNVQVIYDTDSQSATLTSPANTTSGTPLNIGSYLGANIFRWNGAIDDLRIYNRVLSTTEIQAIYTAGAL